MVDSTKRLPSSGAPAPLEPTPIDSTPAPAPKAGGPGQQKAKALVVKDGVDRTSAKPTANDARSSALEHPGDPGQASHDLLRHVRSHDGAKTTARLQAYASAGGDPKLLLDALKADGLSYGQLVASLSSDAQKATLFKTTASALQVQDKISAVAPHEHHGWLWHLLALFGLVKSAPFDRFALDFMVRSLKPGAETTAFLAALSFERVYKSTTERAGLVSKLVASTPPDLPQLAHAVAWLSRGEPAADKRAQIATIMTHVPANRQSEFTDLLKERETLLLSVLAHKLGDKGPLLSELGYTSSAFVDEMQKARLFVYDQEFKDHDASKTGSAARAYVNGEERMGDTSPAVQQAIATLGNETATQDQRKEAILTLDAWRGDLRGRADAFEANGKRIGADLTQEIARLDVVISAAEAMKKKYTGGAGSRDLERNIAFAKEQRAVLVALKLDAEQKTTQTKGANFDGERAFQDGLALVKASQLALDGYEAANAAFAKDPASPAGKQALLDHMDMLGAAGANMKALADRLRASNDPDLQAYLEQSGLLQMLEQGAATLSFHMAGESKALSAVHVLDRLTSDEHAQDMMVQSEKLAKSTETKLATLKDTALNAEARRYSAEDAKLTREIDRLLADEKSAKAVIAEVSAMADPKPSDLQRKASAQMTLDGAPRETGEPLSLRDQIEGLQGLRKIVRTHQALIAHRQDLMHAALSQSMGYFNIQPPKVGNDGDYSAYVKSLGELAEKYKLPWLMVQDGKVTVLQVDKDGRASPYFPLSFSGATGYAQVVEVMERLNQQLKSEAFGMYMLNAKIQHDMWGVDVPGVSFDGNGAPKGNFDAAFWKDFPKNYAAMELQLASFTENHTGSPSAGELGHKRRNEILRMAHGETLDASNYTTFVAALGEFQKHRHAISATHLSELQRYMHSLGKTSFTLAELKAFAKDPKIDSVWVRETTRTIVDHPELQLALFDRGVMTDQKTTALVTRLQKVGYGIEHQRENAPDPKAPPPAAYDDRFLVPLDDGKGATYFRANGWDKAVELRDLLLGKKKTELRTFFDKLSGTERQMVLLELQALALSTDGRDLQDIIEKEYGGSQLGNFVVGLLQSEPWQDVHDAAMKDAHTHWAISDSQIDVLGETHDYSHTTNLLGKIDPFFDHEVSVDGDIRGEFDKNWKVLKTNMPTLKRMWALDEAADLYKKKQRGLDLTTEAEQRLARAMRDYKLSESELTAYTSAQRDQMVALETQVGEAYAKLRYLDSILWSMTNTAIENHNAKVHFAANIFKNLAISAAATAATIATLGGTSEIAAASWAQFGASIVMGTGAGVGAATLIETGNQIVSAANGHGFDASKIGDAAWDSVGTSFSSSLTAALSLGVMAKASLEAVQVGKVGMTIRMAAANMAAAPIGSLVSAGALVIDGKTEEAMKVLSDIPYDTLRAGVSSLVLGGISARFPMHGGVAAFFNGVTGGGEQVAYNLMRGRDWSEGVADSIVGGIVIGHMFEKHGNVDAAKGLKKMPPEHLPAKLRMPGEGPKIAPSWKVLEINEKSGNITVEGPKGQKRTVAAGAFMHANERIFSPPATEVPTAQETRKAALQAALTNAKFTGDEAAHQRAFALIGGEQEHPVFSGERMPNVGRPEDITPTVEALVKHGGDNTFVITSDVRNLSGLNHHMGSAAGANAKLKELYAPYFDALKRAVEKQGGKLHIYSDGAGKLVMVAVFNSGSPAKQQAKLQDAIDSVPPPKALADIPNPRVPTERGVRVDAVITKLDPKKSAAQNRAEGEAALKALQPQAEAVVRPKRRAKAKNDMTPQVFDPRSAPRLDPSVGGDKYSSVAQRKRELIELLGTGGTTAAEAAKIFDARQSTDAVLGLMSKDERYPTAQLALDAVKAGDHQAFYGEMDMGNLRGVTDVLGRDAADGVFRKAVGFYHQRAAEAVRANGGEVHFFRKGGDEIAMVVVFPKPMKKGVDPKKILTMAALKAQTDARHWMMRAEVNGVPLREIVHPKYPDVLSKDGLGITFGLQEMNPNKTLDENFIDADKSVESQKSKKAFLYTREVLALEVGVPEKAAARVAEKLVELEYRQFDKATQLPLSELRAKQKEILVGEGAEPHLVDSRFSRQVASPVEPKVADKSQGKHNAGLTYAKLMETQPDGAPAEFIKRARGGITFEKGITGIEPKVSQVIAAAFQSKFGSVDGKAYNVEHLTSVFEGRLQAEFEASGGRALSQERINELAFETFFTDIFGKGYTYGELSKFQTAPLAQLGNGQPIPGSNGVSATGADFFAQMKGKNPGTTDSPLGGVFLHGIPDFETIKRFAKEAGFSDAYAVKAYEAVIGHHMSGFVAKGFYDAGVTLDFDAMITHGQLSKENGPKLKAMYKAAIELHGKLRAELNKLQPGGRLSDTQRAEFYRLGADLRAAVNDKDFPAHIREQLVNDDAMQFTDMGMGKWASMMAMGAANNGVTIDKVMLAASQYHEENMVRGTDAEFIKGNRPAMEAIGVVFDEKTDSFRAAAPSEPAFDAFARHIAADNELGALLRTAGVDPSDSSAVVSWFKAREPADPAAITRLAGAQDPAPRLESPQEPSRPLPSDPQMRSAAQDVAMALGESRRAQEVMNDALALIEGKPKDVQLAVLNALAGQLTPQDAAHLIKQLTPERMKTLESLMTKGHLDGSDHASATVIRALTEITNTALVEKLFAGKTFSKLSPEHIDAYMIMLLGSEPNVQTRLMEALSKAGSRKERAELVAEALLPKSTDTSVEIARHQVRDAVLHSESESAGIALLMQAQNFKDNAPVLRALGRLAEREWFLNLRPDDQMRATKVMSQLYDMATNQTHSDKVRALAQHTVDALLINDPPMMFEDINYHGVSHGAGISLSRSRISADGARFTDVEAMGTIGHEVFHHVNWRAGAAANDKKTYNYFMNEYGAELTGMTLVKGREPTVREAHDWAVALLKGENAYSDIHRTLMQGGPNADKIIEFMNQFYEQPIKDRGPEGAKQLLARISDPDSGKYLRSTRPEQAPPIDPALGFIENNEHTSREGFVPQARVGKSSPQDKAALPNDVSVPKTVSVDGKSRTFKAFSEPKTYRKESAGGNETWRVAVGEIDVTARGKTETLAVVYNPKTKTFEAVRGFSEHVEASATPTFPAGN